MPQENFHGLIRGLTANNDNCETIMLNIARASLIYRYKRDLNIPTGIRTRLSVGGIHWNEEQHKMSALPMINGIIIDPSDVVAFMFSKSVYNFKNENDAIHEGPIKEWIANVSQGTFRLKTTFKAFYGRHILSRQITNSRCVLPKAEITEEDDVKENEEEKKIRRNISF